MSTFIARALTRAIRDLGYPYVSVRTRAIGPDVFEMRLPKRTAEELGLHPHPGPGNDPKRAERLLSRQLGGPVEVLGASEGPRLITATLRGSLPGFPPEPADPPTAPDGDAASAESACEACGSTRPMAVGATPVRAYGGGLLPAWEFRECLDCGRRFPRFPDEPEATSQPTPADPPAATFGCPALAGESHNITAARRSLTCFAAATKAVADAAELLGAILACAGVDPQTLDDVTTITVTAADLAASAESTLAGLNSRHEVMEQAHAVTAQPARDSFYRPGR